MSALVGEPPQPEKLAPLRVLLRTDGRYIVYDPAQPLGRRTVADADSYADTLVLAWERKGMQE